MRHHVDGRAFGRNTSHRKAMFQNLANAVIEREQVITTIEKAKEVRRVVDRWITLGKKQTLHSKRLAFSRSRSRDTVVKLFGALAQRYQDRLGGYTRVLRLSERRRGDGACMAVLELVDHPSLEKRKQKKEKKKKTPEKEVKKEVAQKPTKPQDAQKKLFSKFSRLFKRKTTKNIPSKELSAGSSKKIKIQKHGD